MVRRRLVVAMVWMAAFLAAPGTGVEVAAASGLTVQTVPGLAILADVW
jgi:hypothetical protein